MPEQSAAAVGQRLQQLKGAFKDQLGDMIGAVQGYWLQLQGGNPSPDASVVNDLYAVVHRITGSAGTFGFHEISRLTAPLESLLGSLCQRQAFPNNHERDQIQLFVEQLVRYWERGDATAEAVELVPTPDPNDINLLYVYGGDSADALIEQLTSFDYRCQHFSVLTALGDALGERLPAALIWYQDQPGQHAQETLAEVAVKVPTLVLSPEDSMGLRLAAVRQGVEAFIPLPVELTDVVTWLGRLTQRSRLHQIPYRVLIVDDDRHLAESYALILQGAGIQTQTLDQPLEILEALAQTTPDLILMDIYMPDCNGIELVQIIRQYWNYLGIPVVYLSVENDSERQLIAKCRGGDDFLCKPIHPRHLVQAVNARVERSRGLQTGSPFDPLTGLLNHMGFKRRLDEELHRVRRQCLPFSLAIIDIDAFHRFNIQHGHYRGDQVLRGLARLLSRRLRCTDVSGRIGMEVFAVIFVHTPVTAAMTVIEELRQSFQQLELEAVKTDAGVTFSAAVMEGDSGSSADMLIQQLQRTLRSAKRRGSNQVVTA